MSKISSDTLFHFTDWDKLISILENGFYPKYSLETFCFSRNIVIKKAIPMVSFCDIPLAQTKLHVKRYGSYGLGLTKKWGITNGINPVLYLKADSNFSLHIRDTSKSVEILRKILIKRKVDVFELRKQSLSMQSHLKQLNSIGIEAEEIMTAVESLTSMLMYIKEYEGYSRRKGEVQKEKVRFYDEREWRFVPNLQACKAELNNLGIIAGLMEMEIFDNPVILAQANALVETAKISFIPNDIRYIIVKKDEEILEMIAILEQIKGDKYSSNSIKILTSRILTYEQIENDF